MKVLGKLAIIRNYRKKKFFQKLIKKGDLCFDIGANIGVKTALFHGLGSKVIAVEPQSECYNTLQSRFRNLDEINLVHAAVGAENGSQELMISNINQISTFSSAFVDAYSHNKRFNWDGRETVKMTTLDALIDVYGTPSFCKIDVEGFEIEVFKGMSKMVPLLSYEMNYPLKDLSIQCLDYLKKFEPLSFNFVPFENPAFYFENWISTKEMREFLIHLDPSMKTGDIYVKQVSK